MANQSIPPLTLPPLGNKGLGLAGLMKGKPMVNSRPCFGEGYSPAVGWSTCQRSEGWVLGCAG